jgi:hypothetical protein
MEAKLALTEVVF